MTFSQSIASVFSQYASFTGRAPRSEYWWFVLFSVIVQWLAGLVDWVLFADYSFWRYGETDLFTPISSILVLALLLPWLSVSARRFHDMDRTAWWLLLYLTGIGSIIIFFWFMFRGTPGPNRYGPDPLS